MTESSKGIPGDQPELGELAAILAEAWDRAETVVAPSVSRPATDLDDAYRIQEMVVERRMAAGHRPTGWKMGLTSSPEAVPIVGTLLDDMVVPSGTRLDLSSMVAPLIEAELAFVVGEQIRPDSDEAAIAGGPHEVAAALEVIDYRTRDSSSSIDWVADNATVAYAVVGQRHRLGEVTSLRQLRVDLECEGESIATGAGSLVMGDPLRAISWLARHLAERGKSLEPGEIVLTGSLTGHHEVAPGRTYAATFDEIGSVSVVFDRAP